MWSAEQLREACALCDAAGIPRPISEQARYNLLCREVEAEVVPAAQELGVGFLWWSPLAQGLLTGKYREGEARPECARLTVWGERAAAFIDDEKLAVVERLTAWAADHGKALLDLAMSWHTSHPLIASVIAGATRPEQVAANVEAAGWRLDASWRDEVSALVDART